MKALTLFLCCLTLSFGQTQLEALLEQKLLARIRAYDRDLDGVLGVAIVDLEKSRVVEYNGDIVFAQASAIKIPIMAQVFRAERSGKLKLDSSVTISKADSVEGSGHLRLLLRSQPLTLTVRELVGAMIETSDNTATNKLIAMVGMDAVNNLLLELNFTKIQLNRRMLDSQAAAANRENVASPLEMARLAEMLYREKLVDADASRQMIEILKRVKADFRSSIPARVQVASKPGAVAGVRTETGIVFTPNRPFVLSVMATYLGGETNPIPNVVKMVYDHFDKLITSNVYGHKLQ